MSSHLHLITGGAQSGKSDYANSLMHYFRTTHFYGSAHKQIDASLRDRVASLAADRPVSCISTEAPFPVTTWLSNAIAQNPGLIVFDCATLWLAATITDSFKRYSTDQLYRHLQKEWELVFTILKTTTVPTIVMCTDVSAGVVPPHLSARIFRDQASDVATQLASVADTVVQMVVGQPLLIADKTTDLSVPSPIMRISHHWYARRISSQSAGLLSPLK